MNQYLGAGHTWTLVTRVTPEGKPPVYLVDVVQLLPVPATESAVEAGGSYLLGEGRYTASLVLLDDHGGVCRKDWQIDARLGRRGRNIQLEMPPGAVAEPSLGGPTHADRTRNRMPPIRLTVLLDAAPQASSQGSKAVLSPNDRAVLLGMVSALLERVPAISVRLVMFNLEEQKEILRRDDFTLDNLDDVADAMKNLKLGTVDYRVLQNPAGKVDLLAGLINREIRAQPPSDAVFFLGQRQQYTDKISRVELDQPSGRAPHFYYLQYASVRRDRIRYAESDPDLPRDELYDNTPGPNAMDVMNSMSLPDPFWAASDTIGRVVEKVNGKTIAVHSPMELAKAICEIGRRTGEPASSFRLAPVPSPPPR